MFEMRDCHCGVRERCDEMAIGTLCGKFSVLIGRAG